MTFLNFRKRPKSFIGESRYMEVPTSPACPYLRLAWDDTIRYGYPDAANCCYKPKKAETISLTYQENVCLSGKSRECSIFILYKKGNFPHPLKKIISEDRVETRDGADALKILMQILYVTGIAAVGIGLFFILMSIISG